MPKNKFVILSLLFLSFLLFCSVLLFSKLVGYYLQTEAQNILVINHDNYDGVKDSFSFLLITENLHKNNNSIMANLSCYTSSVSECDADPFTTASGHRLVSGDLVVANNCLPFGTKVEIAGKIYTVEDKMNSRYGCEKFDLWFENLQNCKNFGIKKQNVFIHN